MRVVRLFAVAGLAAWLGGAGLADRAVSAPASAAAAVTFATYKPELQRLNGKGDWVGLERYVRQALASLQAEQGPNSDDVVAAMTWLAQALRMQGRYDDSVTVSRRVVEITEATKGADGAATADVVLNLAVVLQSAGKFAEAEPLMRRGLASRERQYGPESPQTAFALRSLVSLLRQAGRPAEAEAPLRRAIRILETYPNKSQVAGAYADLAGVLSQLKRYEDAEDALKRSEAIFEKAYGPDSPESITAIEARESLVSQHGATAEAEALRRRVLMISEKADPNSRETARALYMLGEVVSFEGRPQEAEVLLRRAIRIDEAALGGEHPTTASDIKALAEVLSAEGRPKEAGPLMRQALAAREKVLGPSHPDTLESIIGLARLLRAEGNLAEAEALDRRALKSSEQIFGLDHWRTADALRTLAELLNGARRYDEAEGLLKRALVIDQRTAGVGSPFTIRDKDGLATVLQGREKYDEAAVVLRGLLDDLSGTLGADSPQAMPIRMHLAGNAMSRGDYAEAVSHFRVVCAAQSLEALGAHNSTDAQFAQTGELGYCGARLAGALLSWAEEGGDAAEMNHPGDLDAEAFAWAQRAIQSRAGDALARSAALTAAKSAGVGAEAEAYEAALHERDNLNRDYVALAGPDVAGRRAALEHTRADVDAEITRLEAALKAKAPAYWAYRSPQPVGLEELSGVNGALLRDDEALVLWMAFPAHSYGIVFALSKGVAGMTFMHLRNDEIAERVARLRGQIDPGGYGVRSVVQKGGVGPGPFDRQAAYELYQALLGDGPIQEVIRDKRTLLIVPSGSLTSLPPGLLVTAPPQGGPAGDSDPATLRKTPWLLRSKAVAVLPTVSALRTLRQAPAGTRVAAAEPLLAFVDPDFGGAPAAGGVRGFNAYFQDGRPQADVLATLPRLPGTRLEGEALASALGAGAGSLLQGRDASKAQLMARNADGRLGRVRVLEFATHGLVAGDVSGLAEPALVLAAGAKPEDQLLLASEAATLKLNADWVLLSACNTASPDAPEAQGLSGLSRAFFYAGARSLLVSHWRVRDDVAARLIPGMILAERRSPGVSRAEALRQASLAILDDPSLDAASPAAWAPFTLVGEAGR